MADTDELHGDIWKTAEAVARILGLTPKRAHFAPIAGALLAERLAQQKLSGGAAATYFNGLLVLCHPDMPAHVWDGETMKPVEFTVSRGRGGER